MSSIRKALVAKKGFSTIRLPGTKLNWLELSISVGVWAVITNIRRAEAREKAKNTGEKHGDVNFTCQKKRRAYEHIHTTTKSSRHLAFPHHRTGLLRAQKNTQVKKYYPCVHREDHAVRRKVSLLTFFVLLTDWPIGGLH
jgi:hypothetical protein